MKPLHIVVIGSGMYVCGRRTESDGTIIPALLEWGKTRPIEKIWIVATDPDRLSASKERIEQLKKRMGVETRIDYAPLEQKDERAYEKIIPKAGRPACAIVVVPDHLHEPIASCALKHRLHTLIVKPLAATTREAISLIELQRTYGIYGAIEFHKRYDEANLKLRETVRSGVIGEPLYAVVEYSQRKTIPEDIFSGWIPHTNIFQYLGVHYVDILYFVTGAKPLRAMAMGQKRWLISKGIDTYDAIQAVIEWELPSKNRFVSHLLTNWIDPRSSSAMSDQKIKIIGSRGRFESDQKRRGITITTDGKGVEEPNPYFSASFEEGEKLTFSGYGIRSVHQFLKDVSDIERGFKKIEELSSQGRPTFEQALVSTSVVEAVNQSLEENSRWITME